MNALEKCGFFRSTMLFVLGAAGIVLSVIWDMAVAHTPGAGHPTSSTLTCNTPVELGVGTTCTFAITDNQPGGQRTAPLGTASFSTIGVGGFSPANTCVLVQNVATFTSSCSVTYTPTGVGAHTITGSYPLTTQGGHIWSATSATASITIRPRVAKSFSPSSVGTAQSSTLTITLSNYNTFAITGVAFTDNYPSGLVNASPLVAANGCGGALTAAAGGNSIALSGGTIPAASGGAPGACSITVSVASASAGSYVNTIGAGTVSSTNAGTNGTAASATLTVTIAVGAFDAFETSLAAGSTSGPIKTKIAGAGFSLDVVALDVTKTILQSGFSGNIRIDLVGNINTGVATDANGCPVTAGLNQVVSASLAMTSERQTVAFAPVADVWRDVRVKISYPAASPTVISCSTDNFAIRPNAFANFSVTDTDWQTAGTVRTLNEVTFGTVTHKAGRPFTVRADAVNAAGVPAITANYAGSPTPTLATCTGAACTASFGTFTVGAAFALGQLDSSTATYSEVGSFALQLVDSIFSSVDAIDGSTTTERNITSGIIEVGRFVPDHFAVALNAPVFGTACGPGSFTYTGQAFNYTTAPVITVTAQDFASNTTTLYDTIGSWFRITNASLTGKAYTAAIGGSPDTSGVTGTDPVIAASGGGVGMLTFSSGTGLFFARTVPVAPFDADISLAINVIDADGVAYASNPARFGQATAGNGILFNSGKSMRFGRLRLNNAFGSSLLDLPLPLSTQYFNGSFFVTNAADSCTTLAASDIAFSFVGPNLAACDTFLNPGGTLTFTSGNAGVKLTKPGSTKNGAVDLTVNLGASASGNTCTSATSSAATAASNPWLQGNWGSGTYTDNPRGRATFGIYKSADQILYLREVY